MRDIAIAAVVFGLLPFVLTRPHWGILMWTWAGLMVPQSMSYGFMRNFPIAMLIGVVTIIAIVISPEKKRLPLTPPVVVLLVFNVWMNFTTLFALFPDYAWPYWEKTMKVMLMVFLTLLVMQTKARIFALVVVTTASLAYFGVKGGIYTIIRGGEGMVLGPGAGVHGHRNAIAVALVMTLPLMYWLLLQTSNRWLRLAIMGGMGLTAISVLGTGSRGGFLAIAAMGAFLWLKSRHKLVIAVLLILLVPPLLGFMPEQWHARMGTIETYEEDGSSMERLSSWYMAWRLALDRPIIGAGFDCFRPEAFAIWGDPTRFGLRPEIWHDAHSIWFRVLAEHGFPGFGLYLLFWFFSWRTATNIIKQARGVDDFRWAGDLAAMIQVSIVGYLVGGTFINIQYWDYPYILVALLVLTQVVIERAKAAPALDAATAQLQSAHGVAKPARVR